MPIQNYIFPETQPFLDEPGRALMFVQLEQLQLKSTHFIQFIERSGNPYLITAAPQSYALAKFITALNLDNLRPDYLANPENTRCNLCLDYLYFKFENYLWKLHLDRKTLGRQTLEHTNFQTAVLDIYTEISNYIFGRVSANTAAEVETSYAASICAIMEHNFPFFEKETSPPMPIAMEPLFTALFTDTRERIPAEFDTFIDFAQHTYRDYESVHPLLCIQEPQEFIYYDLLRHIACRIADDPIAHCDAKLAKLTPIKRYTTVLTEEKTFLPGCFAYGEPRKNAAIPLPKSAFLHYYYAMLIAEYRIDKALTKSAEHVAARTARKDDSVELSLIRHFNEITPHINRTDFRLFLNRILKPEKSKKYLSKEIFVNRWSQTSISSINTKLEEILRSLQCVTIDSAALGALTTDMVALYHQLNEQAIAQNATRQGILLPEMRLEVDARPFFLAKHDNTIVGVKTYQQQIALAFVRELEKWIEQPIHNRANFHRAIKNLTSENARAASAEIATQLLETELAVLDVITISNLLRQKLLTNTGASALPKETLSFLNDMPLTDYHHITIPAIQTQRLSDEGCLTTVYLQKIAYNALFIARKELVSATADNTGQQFTLLEQLFPNHIQTLNRHHVTIQLLREATEQAEKLCDAYCIDPPLLLNPWKTILRLVASSDTTERASADIPGSKDERYRLAKQLLCHLGQQVICFIPDQNLGRVNVLRRTFTLISLCNRYNWALYHPNTIHHLTESVHNVMQYYFFELNVDRQPFDNDRFIATCILVKFFKCFEQQLTSLKNRIEKEQDPDQLSRLQQSIIEQTDRNTLLLVHIFESTGLTQHDIDAFRQVQFQSGLKLPNIN